MRCSYPTICFYITLVLGWNDSSEVPDHAVAAEAVGILQELYGRMAKMQPVNRS